MYMNNIYIACNVHNKVIYTMCNRVFLSLLRQELFGISLALTNSSVNASNYKKKKGPLHVSGKLCESLFTHCM